MKTTKLGLITLLAGFFMACGTESTPESSSTETMDESMNVMSEVSTAAINLDQSIVTWKGTMVGVYSHEGTLTFSSGNLQTTGDRITGGSFTVDMTSMNPTDENYNVEEEKTPEKLVGHLSSPDFFDVANFPTASFKISGSEGNKVMGTMTIRGKSNSEIVENVSYNASTRTWTGTMTIDRKKYDVTWDSPMKEMVLENDLELTINLTI